MHCAVTAKRPGAICRGSTRLRQCRNNKRHHVLSRFPLKLCVSAAASDATATASRADYRQYLAEAEKVESEIAVLKKQIQGLESKLAPLVARAEEARSKAHACMLQDDALKIDRQQQLYNEAIHQLQSWLGPGYQLTKTVRQDMGFRAGKGVTGAMVAVCTAQQLDATSRAAVVAVVADAGVVGGNAAVNGASKLSVHWGCAADAAAGWRPPPAGWHTLPDRSFDAGGGAWRTPMMAVPAQAGMEVMILEVPMDAVLNGGGFVFVLCTADGRWLKASDGKNLFVSFRDLVTLEVDSTGISRTQRSAAQQNGKAQREEDGGHDGMDVLANMTSQQRRDALSRVRASVPSRHHFRQFGSDAFVTAGWRGGGNEEMMHRVVKHEGNAQRSLMHRYNIANDLFQEAALQPSQPAADAAAAAAALAVWLRYSAARHLKWNSNYNVKPREVSAAQDRLTRSMTDIAQRSPELSDIIRLAMAAVGRGGRGDMGQRIRDEILAIQHRNNAKGGMMEEWHQKLHNNTSPDDVIICEALIAYIDAGCDVDAYWRVLHAANIDKARLASFDRPIVSEPNFKRDECEALRQDLVAYGATLKAVHCGEDLEMASLAVLGYRQHVVKGKEVVVEPVQGIDTDSLRSIIAAAVLLQRNAFVLDADHALSPSAVNAQPAAAASTAAAPPAADDEPTSEMPERPASPAQRLLNSMFGSTGKPSAVDEDGFDVDSIIAEQLAAAGPAAAVKSAAAAVQKTSVSDAAAVVDGVMRYIDLLNEARTVLQDAMAQRSIAADRLRDVVYMDIALEGAARGALESCLQHVKARLQHDSNSDGNGTAVAIVWTAKFVAVAVEAAAWSLASNQELMLCLNELNSIAHSAASSTKTDVGATHVLWVRLHAVIERSTRFVQAYAQQFMAAIAPTSETLGKRLNVDATARTTMAEDMLRSTAIAPLSQLLAAVAPRARAAARLGSWTVVSSGSGNVVGELVAVQRLSDVAQTRYRTPTVLIAQHVDGSEDIPIGAVGVVTSCQLDMLCHAAVRARNCGALLACCADSDEISAWSEDVGTTVACTIEVQGGKTVVARRRATLQDGASTTAQHGSTAQQLRLTPHGWCQRWAIDESEYSSEKVGQKALNLKLLRDKLPSWIAVPPSFGIPFGAFEAVLSHPTNADLAAALHELGRTADTAQQRDALQRVQHRITHNIHVPNECGDDVMHALANLCGGDQAAQQQQLRMRVWHSIARVWASKWRAVAVNASSRLRLSHADVRIAVLCQPVVDVQYSFVAHTTDPSTRDDNVLCCEIVLGLGETLVGSWPGSAMRVSIDKSAVHALLRTLANNDSQRAQQLPNDAVLRIAYATQIHCMLSKPHCLFPYTRSAAVSAQHPAAYGKISLSGSNGNGTANGSAAHNGSTAQQGQCCGLTAHKPEFLPEMIFRSDSNAEDLPGYAGAGVFESVMLCDAVPHAVDYSVEPLVNDVAVRQRVVAAIALACCAVEQSMGGNAQDIEGAVTRDGVVVVLQSRPQV